MERDEKKLEKKRSVPRERTHAHNICCVEDEITE